MEKIEKYIYLLMVFIGVAFISLGYEQEKRENKIIATGNKTTATIVGKIGSIKERINKREFQRNDSIYFPVYEFKSADNIIYSVQGRAGTGRVKIGEKRTIYYDTKNPTKYFSVVEDSWINYLPYILGVFFILSGLIMYYKDVRKASQKKI